tara:strand:- start:233 stop:625 length:393 start_codon:yes stop_codon:yes gene_type:complete
MCWERIVLASVLKPGQDHLEVSDGLLIDMRQQIEEATQKQMIRIVYEQPPGAAFQIRTALTDAVCHKATGSNPDTAFEDHCERIMRGFDPTLVIPAVVVILPLNTTSVFLSPLPWATATDARSHMATLEL